MNGIPFTDELPYPFTWTAEKLDDYQRLQGQLEEALNRGFSIVRNQDVPPREAGKVIREQCYLMVSQTEAGDEVKRFFLEENGLSWQEYTGLHGTIPR